MFEFSWFWLGFWMLAAYIVLSFRIIDYDQIGARFFLGHPWKESGPGGWHFIPPLISWGRLFTTNAIQLELPNPEKVQKANQDNLAQGKEAPIRTTQAETASAVYWYEDEKTHQWTSKKFADHDAKERAAIRADPLNLRLTTEPVVIVRWRLRRKDNAETLFQFIKNIGSVEEANKQIEDTVVSTLRTLFAKVTAGNALSAMALFSQEIRKRVEILIGEKGKNGRAIKNAETSWSIDLLDVQIKEIDPGETVNNSLYGRGGDQAQGGRNHSC